MKLREENMKNVQGLAPAGENSNIAEAEKKNSSGDGARGLTWVDLVAFYPAPQDCLAAFLVSSAAEVLRGVKPANLIRIVRRRLPCGRSLYGLWQDFGAQVLHGSALSALTLRDNDDGVLLLLYRPELLEVRLKGRTMRTFLQRMGYPAPGDLASCLRHLQKSFADHNSPDEVGLFLGYPVKDVKRFMTGHPNPWQGRCLWRIYGPPSRSLRLYRRYCEERRQMTGQLISGVLPATLLKAA